MTSVLRRFRSAEAASVLTVFAVALPVLIGAAAFGVDAGLFFLERRALQKAADAAALAAAVDPDRADAVVRRMLASNGHRDVRFTLSFGRYQADPALSRDERYVSGDAANAVSIEAQRSVPTLFARIFGQQSATIGVRARAAVTPVVSFAIGSRLASVDPPVLDAVLRPLIGGPLALTVMDYRGLVGSKVETGDLLRVIASVNGMAPDASVGEVLRRPVALSAVLAATAGELNRAGDAAGAGALRKAARNTAGLALRVVPGDLLGFGDGTDGLRLDYPNEALRARVSVLSLLFAAITDRSIGSEVTAGVDLPGLARADVGLLLGEAETGASGAVVGRAAENGPSAATAQARLRLRVRLDAGVLIPGAEAEIPFELVAAGARATVVSATCSADPRRREVRLLAEGGLARLSLGLSDAALDRMSLEDAVRPAGIAAGAGLRIEVGSSIVLKRRAPVIVTFRGAEIGDGTVKTVRTRNLAESLVATLIDDATISVRLSTIGLNLGLPDTIKRAVRTLLAGLVQPVDDLLDASLAAAGIGLGEADIRVDDLVCGHARLVG